MILLAWCDAGDDDLIKVWKDQNLTSCGNTATTGTTTTTTTNDDADDDADDDDDDNNNKMMMVKIRKVPTLTSKQGIHTKRTPNRADIKLDHSLHYNTVILSPNSYNQCAEEYKCPQNTHTRTHVRAHTRKHEKRKRRRRRKEVWKNKYETSIQKKKNFACLIA